MNDERINLIAAYAASAIVDDEMFRDHLGNYLISHQKFLRMKEIIADYLRKELLVPHDQ